MNTKVTYIVVMVILSIFMGLFIFIIRKTMNDEAYYGVYIGYPLGYISEYNNAHSILKNEKNEVILHFGGDNATEGGMGRGVQNSPQANMEVPSKIEVMWFSVAENQFWRGEFEFSKKDLANALNNEKILDLFTTRQGKSLNKYSQIVVNVAPKGKVYLYLNGISTKLIGIFQAKPIQYDWLQHVEDTWIVINRDHIDSQEEYVDVLTKHFKDLINKINDNYKEDFFTPVRWKLRIKGDKKILAYAVNTVNGEHTQVLDNPTEQEIKSIPTKIAFDVEENLMSKKKVR